MASRERLASGRAPEAVRRAEHASAVAPIYSDDSWGDILLQAPASLQKDLLALAQRQGFLYAHQLPEGHNGTPKEKPHFPATISQLLDGTNTDLEPVRVAPPSEPDLHLDPAQREAVAKALATPDICLVRGLPGTGKSRAVAAIVSQATARGERVLLVAAAPPANDCILEMLPEDAVCAIRCLDPGQRVESLPARLRKWTFAEQVIRLQSAGLIRARDELARQEQRARDLRADEPIWRILIDLALAIGTKHAHAAELAGAHARVAEQVQAEFDAAPGQAAAADSTFQIAIGEKLAVIHDHGNELDQSLADVRQRLEKCRTETDGIVPTLATLRELMAARQSWRVWTSAWWQAFRRRDLESELQKTEDRQRDVTAEAARLAAEMDRLTEERSAARTRGEAELRDHCQQEIRRRETELACQSATLNNELGALQEKWHAALAALAPETERPHAISADAVRQAGDLWAGQLQHAGQMRDFLGRWIAFLEQFPPWNALLPGSANLVVATLGALAVDPQVGGASAHGRGFDLLILQEADRFGEAEIRSLASRARRFVLVGEPSLQKAAPAPAPAKRIRESAEGSDAYFDRLWQQFHWEPRGLPYSWVREGDQLCCRLRPVPTDLRLHLERERLADFPDIELRILARPRMEPMLAEVAFPRSFSIADAKAFIFRELDELAVHSTSTRACWTEDTGRILFQLAHDSLEHMHAVALEAGVREWVAEAHRGVNGTGTEHWQTCCLEFDQAMGWDRRRAEEWIRRRLGGHDLGRTARLDTPHRMQPALAAWVSDVACAGEYRPIHASHVQPADGATMASNGHCAGVEFVAVPPLRGAHAAPGRFSTNPPAGRSGSPSLARKGGAGLEIDLADARHRSRLPASIQCDLPGRGLVNYAEAEAVVQALERLVTSMLTKPAPAIAVLAMYPAQVHLIRHLVRRSAPLTSATVEIVIDLASEVREREFNIVLVSLTRSHSHRPVTYGDSPSLLTVALTRARDRLILFGDPGSLGRRSQWDGPLDHLSEALAARERDVLARMFDYVHGHGSASGFVLREGANP